MSKESARSLLQGLQHKDTRLHQLLETMINDLYSPDDAGSANVPFTDISYVSGDFLGSASLVWTVASDDVLSYGYSVTNGMMYVSWRLNNTTLSGTAANQINIKIPAGYKSRITKPNDSWLGSHEYENNAIKDVGFSKVVGDSDVISLYRRAQDNYVLETDLFKSSGSITFPVKRK